MVAQLKPRRFAVQHGVALDVFAVQRRYDRRTEIMVALDHERSAPHSPYTLTLGGNRARMLSMSPTSAGLVT